MQVSRVASTIRGLLVAPAVSLIMFYSIAPVQAKVEKIDFKDLVAHSDLIVVVTVTWMLVITADHHVGATLFLGDLTRGPRYHSDSVPPPIVIQLARD
jgi:hypothetical protein